MPENQEELLPYKDRIFILDNYAKMADVELARKIGKPEELIKQYAKSVGLSRSRYVPKRERANREVRNAQRRIANEQVKTAAERARDKKPKGHRDRPLEGEQIWTLAQIRAHQLTPEFSGKDIASSPSCLLVEERPHMTIFRFLEQEVARTRELNLLTPETVCQRCWRERWSKTIERWHVCETCHLEVANSIVLPDIVSPVKDKLRRRKRNAYPNDAPGGVWDPSNR